MRLLVFFSIGPMILGFLLDLLLGDPVCLYHPVRLWGMMIARLEKSLRQLLPGGKGEAIAGMLLAVICVGSVCIFYNAALGAAWRLGAWAWFLAQSFICYRMLAVRDLHRHSMLVYSKLKSEDIEGARDALSRIVGRDVRRLDEAGVIRAAVETVSESTADGIAAPLFYMAMGGAGLCVAYKMINTLDSMVGYKNKRYLRFGRCSARLDDIAGFIPARMAALCMILASGACGFDMCAAARVWRRDRRAHASPNSAQTESACAGALGLRLGGTSVYGGEAVRKPTIGDDIRPPSRKDIPAANRLMLITAVLALLVTCGLRIFAVLLYLLYLS